MNQFRSFTQVRTNQLWMQRHGFWKPWYDFTEGQFSYGKLSYDGTMMRTAIIETADEHWRIIRKSIWSDAQVINNMQNQPIGEISREGLKSNFRLVLNDGFEVTFKRTSIWKGNYHWADVTGQVLAETTQHAFSSRYVRFNIDQLQMTVLHLPVLLITGAHLINRINQRAAAAS